MLSELGAALFSIFYELGLHDIKNTMIQNGWTAEFRHHPAFALLGVGRKCSRIHARDFVLLHLMNGPSQASQTWRMWMTS